MTRSDALQKKLDEVYNFIACTSDDRGYPPTLREIAKSLNIKSTGSVSYYIKKLEEAGRLSASSGKNRSISLVDSQRVRLRDFVSVPLVGNIPAGEPRLAIEECEDEFALPSNLFSLNGENFLLRVQGKSMIEAGINDGDYILVKKQNTANNGQIVAAFINGESATVKRYYWDGRRVRLHPENKTMQDFYPEDVAILGIVVGLIRTKIS